jgi:gluconate 2-dehydrogenase gamma chain
LIDNKKRRDFLKQAGTVWGATLLASEIPVIALAASRAREQQQSFAVLSPSEALELEAIAARIIPTTDTPGAREAGAIWFIDQALAASLADALPALRQGLAALQKGVDGPFANLDEVAQDSVLRQHEDSAFFSLLRFLTVAGTFAMPELGGNRDHVGWQLLGFDHRHAWTPPFGYYDAGENNPQEDNQ